MLTPEKPVTGNQKSPELQEQRTEMLWTEENLNTERPLFDP